MRIMYAKAVTKVVTAVLMSVLLAGCGHGKSVILSGEEVYKPEYAERYAIYGTNGLSTVLEVCDPWQGADGEVSQIFVSRGGETAPEGFDGWTVEAPVEKVVCFSSTYVAFFDALDATDRICGVSGADYISNEKIRARYALGDVRDVGFDTGMNYELLAAMRPDIVLLYGVGSENTAVSDKLRELRIPFLYVGEYVEGNPLGRAEWIVPFGELIDRRAEAKEAFDGIAARYDSLRVVAGNFTDRPKVMLNAPYRDVWFVPGDRSYMVSLINDAGGEYLFAGEDTSVSRPISGEAAYMASLDADVWLNPGQATDIASLKSEHPKFTNIRCVHDGRVYNSIRRSTPAGGNDFWESGVLYADRVLRDLMICFHPEAGDEESMYYFERLQ